jgi:molecular chaperone DnaJ
LRSVVCAEVLTQQIKPFYQFTFNLSTNIQMSNSNHYDTLDVSPQATSTEIKQAYRRLAKRFHPDSQSETADPEKIIQVNAAYEILSDPNRRRSYDQQLRYPQPLNTETEHNGQLTPNTNINVIGKRHKMLMHNSDNGYSTSINL